MTRHGARPPLSRRKRLVFGALALSLGLLVGLALAEALCRVFYGSQYQDQLLNYYPPGSVIHDRDIGWAYRPGYHGHWRYFEYKFDVAINSLGLRDREYGSKSARRILFVGDSFTFGVGVDGDRTFVKRTEALLGHDRPAECINGGRIASGTDIYFHYVRKYAPLLNPDMVVVCLLPENDFDDTWDFNHERPAYHDVGGEVYLGRRPMARERRPPKSLLIRHSALYRFLRPRLAVISFNLGKHPFTRKWLNVYLRREPPWIGAAAPEVERNLNEIQRICRERGMALALVLIPADLDLHPDLRARMLDHYGASEADYDWDKPFAWFARYGRRAGIPVLDLRAPLRLCRGSLHYKHDRHFTAAGHQAAAQALAPFLEGNLK